jgi:beta-lactam-binding protein with PASTA domain
VVKIKLPASLINGLNRIGHFFRSLKDSESEKTRFGQEKPKFIISLQKRKWLWRTLSSITLIALLIFITAFMAYITMVLTIRGEEVNVPDLESLNTTEAIQILSELDLKLRIEEKRQYSKGVEEGKIIKQEPSPGISIKRNNTIRVTLSAGTRTIIVPSLIGQSARNASSIFASKGLNLSTVSQVHCDYVVTNNIIAQEPLPASELIRGSRVNILVSLGSRERLFVMPDLIGKDYDLVAPRITGAGFRIGNVFNRRYPGVRPNVIIMQYPKAGYSVSKTDIINLWISE